MVINKNSRKIKKNNLNSNQKNDQKLSKIRKKHLKIKKDLEDRLMESKEGIEYIHKQISEMENGEIILKIEKHHPKGRVIQCKHFKSFNCPFRLVFKETDKENMYEYSPSLSHYQHDLDKHDNYTKLDKKKIKEKKKIIDKKPEIKKFIQQEDEQGKIILDIPPSDIIEQLIQVKIIQQLDKLDKEIRKIVKKKLDNIINEIKRELREQKANQTVNQPQRQRPQTRSNQARQRRRTQKQQQQLQQQQIQESNSLYNNPTQSNLEEEDEQIFHEEDDYNQQNAQNNNDQQQQQQQLSENIFSQQHQQESQMGNEGIYIANFDNNNNDNNDDNNDNNQYQNDFHYNYV